jgi:hypothetical protein
VTPTEFFSLREVALRVPLSQWRRSLLGVVAWILLPLAPGSERQPAPSHERLIKGLLHLCLFQMAMDGWEVARGVMEAGLRLQRWLAGEESREVSVNP